MCLLLHGAGRSTFDDLRLDAMASLSLNIGGALHPRTPAPTCPHIMSYARKAAPPDCTLLAAANAIFSRSYKSWTSQDPKFV